MLIEQREESSMYKYRMYVRIETLGSFPHMSWKIGLLRSSQKILSIWILYDIIMNELIKVSLLYVYCVCRISGSR